MQAEEAPDGSIPLRQRTLNIQVGKRPLIVRTLFDRESLVIGQLLPGQIATVLEERVDMKTGDVRAWRDGR